MVEAVQMPSSTGAAAMPESQTVTVQATAPPARARASGGEESPLLWRSALVGPRWTAVRFVFMLVSQLIELPCELQDGRSHPCIGLSCRHGAAPRGLFAVFSSKSHRPLDEWPHTIRNSVLDTRFDRLIHKSQFTRAVSGLAGASAAAGQTPQPVIGYM